MAGSPTECGSPPNFSIGDDSGATLFLDRWAFLLPDSGRLAETSLNLTCRGRWHSAEPDHCCPDA
jgi:hypothetical protein